jgi:O-antigen/teichoic acid export membrane protein
VITATNGVATPPDRPADLTRSTALLLAAQLYYRAGGFVVFMILSRTIAAADLGLYLLALACSEALVVVASLSLDPVLMRRVAVDPSTTAATVSSAIGSRLALAPVYLGAVAAVAWVIDPASLPVMLAVAALTVADSFYLSFSALFVAVDRVGLTVGIGVVVQTAYLVAAAAALWAAPSLSTFLAVCGLRALALLVAGPTIARRKVARFSVGWDGSLLREAVPFALLTLAMVAQDRTDVMVLGWLTGYEEVARYGLALRVVVVSMCLPLAASQVMYPSLARPGPGTDRRRTVGRTLAWLVVLGGAIAGVAGGWSRAIAGLLYGPLAATVAPVLRAAAPLIALQFAIIVLTVALQALGRERGVLAIVACAAATGLGLELALVPTMGVFGAVIARLTAAIGQLLVLVWATWRATADAG